MAVYRRQQLSGISPPDVSIAPLRGGRIAKQNRFHAVHRGVDKVGGMGRRVVLSHLTESQARGRHDLAPGNVLALSVMHLPCGGTVDVDIDWTDADGSTTSTSHSVALAQGDELALPWGGIKVKRIPKMEPETLAATDTLRDWSRHTHCEITVTANEAAAQAAADGSPKIIDICVHEIPADLSLEEDDADDLWISSFFHGPTPEGIGPGLQYPIQRFSETTPDGNRLWGTYSLMDAVNAQAIRLGPQLFSWAATDSSAGQSIERTDAGSWVRVGDGAVDSDATALVADDQYGWSMSSGAYGKPVAENPDASMGNTGSIPVRVYVYLESQMTPGDTFRLRVYTAPYNYVQVTGTVPIGGSPAWFTGYGHLRCGKGPGDFVKATAVIINDGSPALDDIELKAVKVYRAEQYAPAA